MAVPLRLRDQPGELRTDQLTRQAVTARCIAPVVLSGRVGVEPDGMLRGAALDEDREPAAHSRKDERHIGIAYARRPCERLALVVEDVSPLDAGPW